MIDLAAMGLKRGDLVLLDSGPLIYYVDGMAGAGGRDADRAAVVRFFADAAKAGHLRLAASVLVWTECLSGPLVAASGRADDSGRADAYRKTLSDSGVVVLEPVDAAIADEAARLSALPAKPGFADAFHLATAAVLGAAAVLTNDGAWRPIVAAAARPGASSRPAAFRNLRTLLVDELVFDL